MTLKFFILFLTGVTYVTLFAKNSIVYTLNAVLGVTLGVTFGCYMLHLMLHFIK